MNHVLLFEQDFCSSDCVVLNDYRFTHIQRQLKAAVGNTVKVGLLNGLCGNATVTDINASEISLNVNLNSQPPAPSPLKLILALPRPKVFRRVLRSAVEHGIKEIHLINSWRVEKSYWQSPLLQAHALNEAIYEGLSIAKDTLVPTIHQHKLFKPFVEDELSQLVNGNSAYIAHPSDIPCPSDCTQSTWLAIGPEGGFNDFEVGLLNAEGFISVSLGARILRVENAVSTALGRMNPL